MLSKLPNTRNRQFRLRLTDDDLAMIKALRRHVGKSGASIVRDLVRREYAAIIGAAPARLKKGKK